MTFAGMYSWTYQWMTFAVISTNIEKFRSDKTVIQPKRTHGKENHAKERRMSKQKHNITKECDKLMEIDN